MAKKKEVVKERLLRKLLPPVEVAVDGSDFTAKGSGWRIITATNSLGNPTHWVVWRGYFDLSGLVVDQLTLFTVNPMFQEGCDWNYTSTSPTGAIQVWDMITQEYITDATFDGVLAASGNWIPPGLSGGQSTVGATVRTGAPYDLEDVHYGNARSFQYGAVTALGASPFLPNQTRSSSWGTGSATAGQKLYITRALHLSSALSAEPLNSIVTPPTAVVVPALIAEETDLRYIERLRRSYVLQEPVD